MGLALFVAFCLLASVLAPAASGQSQTVWHVNDNPSLNGPSRYWWAGDAGKGYGSNNYVYTYGTAGESSTGNWARWSMGKRVGRQEIQAYVPNTRATATVLYRIDIGGAQHTKRIAQNNAYGWTSLGAYNADSDTVTITLRDNEASQHWNRHGYNKSSIGVDAIRMRCISSCSTGPEIIVVPTPTQAPRVDEPSAPRSLRVSADEDSATVSWSAPSDNGGASVSGYRADLYRGNTRVDRKNLPASQRSATFTGLNADTAYQIRISAENSAGRGDRATASFRTDAARQPRASAPGAPRIVGFVNGADTVGVVWNPPSDNGGAPITGYTIDLYHNNRRIDTKTVASEVRETTFTGLSPDTAYQVRITAHNTAGTSNPRTANARTGAATRAPSAPRNLRVTPGENSATVSWSPPSDNGGTAISGYRADLYRANTRVDRKNLSASQRSAAFAGLSADTAYQIRISAENSAGRSNRAAANFRTHTAPQRQQARSVTIALAADRAGCSDTSKPCRWLSASYSGFSPGTYRVRCYWSTSPNSLGSQFATFTTSRINGTNPALCYFNGTPGRHLTVVVDGVQSNTIQFTGTPPAPQATAPGAPRIVGFVNDTDTVGVVWNPPSDNGGAPITGYTIDLHHNNRRINTKTLGPNTRETTFTGLSPDTAYQIRITAHNTAGTSNPRTANARTNPATSTPSTPRNLRVTPGENSATVSWSPPSDNGGAAISGYRADLYRANTRIDRKNLPASQRSTTFAGLSADTAYQIRLSAQNTAGRSNRAAASFRTDPASTRQESGLPSEPRSIRVTAGKNRATVSWSPPASNGNNPLTGYQAELFRGGTFITRQNLTASQRSTSFSNLSANTAYQVLISARNNQGLSTPTAADFTTDAPEDTRSVTVTLGADRANCQDASKPCRWLSAQFSGFTPGRHNAHCYYSTTPTSLGTRFWTGTADTTTASDPTLCWLNATPGLHLTAIIGGVQSNTIQLAGTVPTAPGPPRNVRAVPVNGDQIKVAWDPPANSGSSPISHYTINFSRPFSTFSQTARVNATAGNTYTYPGNLRYNTLYTIKITAINQSGLPGSTSTTTARTNTKPSAEPGSPRRVRAFNVISSGSFLNATHDIHAEWSPPSDTGNSPIKHYVVEFSRPADGWTHSMTVQDLFANYKKKDSIFFNKADYTVTVTAVNWFDKTSKPVRVKAANTPVEHPTPPKNVKVEILPQENGQKIQVTWDPPQHPGSYPITRYYLELTKPSTDKGVKSTLPKLYVTGTSHIEDVSLGDSIFEVEATVLAVSRVPFIQYKIYELGSRPATVRIIPPPEPVVQNEDWNLKTFWDDSDAVVSWTPIDDAEHYDLDWQYIDINDGGNVVPQDKIDPFLTLNNKPEIKFNVADSTYIDLRKPDVHDSIEWKVDPLVDPSYRINHRQDEYILQSRVRATGTTSDGVNWDTGYSDWYYDPRSVLSNGCVAYQVYNAIKQILDAINVANAILTAVALAGTVVSFGASAVAGGVARSAISNAAKKIVMEFAKKAVVKNAVKKMIQKVVHSIAKGVAKEVITAAADLSVLFICIAYAKDGDKWTEENAKHLAEDTLRELMKEKNKERTIQGVIDAVVKGMGSREVYKHFSRR